MKRTLILMTVLTGFSSLPMIALAETNGDAALLSSASMSLEAAGQQALKLVPGTLVAVGLNDEDGRGVFEATIDGSDGQVWMVKLDATNGNVLGMGLASLMDDEGDGDHETDDGETADDSEQG